jgi:cytochrome c oxidase subunit 2
VRFALVLLAASAVAAGQGRPGDTPAAGAGGTERVISLTARRFSYSPSVIELELGVPVIIELTSLDREHGFNIPDLGLRADVEPGKTVRVRIVPDKLGTFPFHCDIFCAPRWRRWWAFLVVGGPSTK